MVFLYLTFTINREIKNGFIYKHISFVADGNNYKHTEQVKYLDLPKMKDYLTKVGFTIKHVFGNYALENFKEDNADRLIIVAK